MPPPVLVTHLPSSSLMVKPPHEINHPPHSSTPSSHNSGPHTAFSNSPSKCPIALVSAGSVGKTASVYWRRILSAVAICCAPYVLNCLVSLLIIFSAAASSRQDDGSEGWEGEGEGKVGGGEEGGEGRQGRLWLSGLWLFWNGTKLAIALSPILFIVYIFMSNSNTDPKYQSKRKPDFSFNVD
eukprot:GHVQ01021536.1.p1 GENE.GHVQ01021536.1~~GHVQ01021536.1.p1  ORF type:complete len:183 (+),score=36.36 GHVQ01021536.1:264-812(+)